jgi:hypothetical protein
VKKWHLIEWEENVRQRAARDAKRDIEAELLQAVRAEHVNDRETRWVMSLESRRRAWLGSREPGSAVD